jgi:hypothetical protein
MDAENALSSILSWRGVIAATTITVAEAGVWTQVGFLPHWLLVTTTFFTVLSFLALTFEAPIAALCGRFARLLWIVHGFFAVSVV